MDEWNAVEILLAEDNDLDAELTLRALRKIGVGNKVLRVHDGADALAFLFRAGQFAQRDHAQPKLVLLDLHMQKIGGLEVLRQIRQRGGSASMAVGILTSSTSDTDFFESQELLAWEYVVKPVDPQALIDLIKQAGL
jgi:two-component system response regulator